VLPRRQEEALAGDGVAPAADLDPAKYLAPGLEEEPEAWKQSLLFAESFQE
jgi:hypothetical protein